LPPMECWSSYDEIAQMMDTTAVSIYAGRKTIIYSKTGTHMAATISLFFNVSIVTSKVGLLLIREGGHMGPPLQANK